MAAIKGPIICQPTSLAKGSTPSGSLISCRQLKNVLSKSGMLGLRLISRSSSGFNTSPSQKKANWSVQCSHSSFSDGNGSTAGNFSANDDDYVNSTVMEAVEVRSGSDGFVIKMRDGQHIRCVHNNPQALSLPDYAPHPAIVLKIEDGSELMLPIIVMEMPSVMLMAAVRDIQIARPTIYNVVKEMIDKLGYKVQLARVTKRVNEAYFAELLLAKVGDENQCISFDLRPSDAINIAVRCQAPIQVNRLVAYGDGMKAIESRNFPVRSPNPEGILFNELDRADDQAGYEALEFDLVRNMLIAAVEERYKDAAQYRDKLYKLRTKKQRWI